jgi:molybdopterin synthase sulfur carrier subunit
VKVNFYATLRQVVGRKTVEFSLPEGANIKQLVDEIVRGFPLLRRELINAEGELHGHVHVFINGRDSTFLSDGLNTEIFPDDVISIFPAVGGG